MTSIFGDGSYLMLNSEIYSAAFAGLPYVAVLCDNEGFAVINRLQTSQGADGFNNLFADSHGPGATSGGVRVDFAAHARSMGCHVEEVADSGRPRRLAHRLRRRAGRGRRRAAARRRGLSRSPSPPGPSPAPGGRPARPRHCPAMRRTTRARRARSAGVKKGYEAAYMASEATSPSHKVAGGSINLTLVVHVEGVTVAQGHRPPRIGHAPTLSP